MKNKQHVDILVSKKVVDKKLIIQIHELIKNEKK